MRVRVSEWQVTTEDRRFGSIQKEGKVSTVSRERGRGPDARRGYWLAKRLLDLVLSLFFLIAWLPIFALIALLIKLDSPGPAFYRQRRMGYDRRAGREKPFWMLKFRTMYVETDGRIHQAFVQRWANGEVDNGVAKLLHDPRITRVGHLLRRTSLDELPQFWNVLKGEMSLVGPRPVPLYEVAHYNAWQRQRLKTVPGITGLWQVRGRGRATLDEMARLDIDYIKHQSLKLDLKILLWTIPAAVKGYGAN